MNFLSLIEPNPTDSLGSQQIDTEKYDYDDNYNNSNNNNCASTQRTLQACCELTRIRLPPLFQFGYFIN